jgi:hypothetical protein
LSNNWLGHSWSIWKLPPIFDRTGDDPWPVETQFNSSAYQLDYKT